MKIEDKVQKASSSIFALVSCLSFIFNMLAYNEVGTINLIVTGSSLIFSIVSWAFLGNIFRVIQMVLLFTTGVCCTFLNNGHDYSNMLVFGVIYVLAFGYGWLRTYLKEYTIIYGIVVLVLNVLLTPGKSIESLPRFVLGVGFLVISGFTFYYFIKDKEERISIDENLIIKYRRHIEELISISQNLLKKVDRTHDR